MASIYPIPSGRSSDVLLRTRLLAQLQSQQQQLLLTQQQAATGRRVLVPSQDVSAATRSMALQRLLESKQQTQTNLHTTQSYLDATDTALSGVATLLANVRGLAIRAADSTTSQLERQALGVEVDEAISQMLRIGNQKFRDRYLFGGSQTASPPFETSNGNIAYTGNDRVLRSFADIELLLETNVPAQDLFGAVSAEVKGIDLNPTVSPTTRLSDLNNGQGVASGGFIVSDGTYTNIVDITGAETLGDVARLIQANPPEGRELWVTITETGLRIEMDSAGGGSLIVRDTLGSTTARDLGIARSAGRAIDPIEGLPLNPIVRKTTLLSDILGTGARALIRSPGSDNDIVLQARNNGTAQNGFTIQFVDDNLLQAAPGLSAGNERAELHTSAVAARAALPLSGQNNDLLLTATTPGTSWNNISVQLEPVAGLGNNAIVSFQPDDNVLNIQIDAADQTAVGTLINAINATGLFTAAADPSQGESLDLTEPVLAIDAGMRGNTGNSGAAGNSILVYLEAGHSTANGVVTAMEGNPEIDALFEVGLNNLDSSSAALAGAKPIDINAHATTEGGTGIDLDQQSGLEIVNNGQTHVIDLQEAKTVEDLLNLLNGSDAMVLAEINEKQTGISVRSRLSGSDFAIGEHGGSTASDLGIRSLNRETRLSSLNYSRGIRTADGTDFVVHRNDGVDLEIDISDAQTLGDVIDLINNHPNNQNPDTAIVADLAAFGNGIELTDDNPTGTDTLSITRGGSSFAVWDLGLVPQGEVTGSRTAETTAQAALADLAMTPPNHLNTAITLTANQAGTGMNNVQIELINSAATGDQALVSFDTLTRTLTIDVDPTATTANTVVTALNNAGTFQATLNRTADPSNDGTGQMVDIGILTVTTGGTADQLKGQDMRPLEAQGIFNSLLRLRDAINDANVEDVQRIIQLFDQDFDQLNFGRAALGARGRSVDAILTQQQDEDVALQATLSQEIDIDLTKAITDLTAQQTAYQATLQTMAGLFQLTLLDFI